MKQELLEQAKMLFQLSLLDLIHQAHLAHREHHDPNDIQKCALLSVKTGGCQEDCSYCPQSSHYKTDTKGEPMMSLEETQMAARRAKQQGAQRFCMGFAWRNIKDGPLFERLLDLVKVVAAEDLEVCITAGMLTAEQAERLKSAGVYAYNHNLDTSREYYSKIISTRTYEDRLETLGHVRNSGMTVCCGGIIGMGESDHDRCALIAELASLEPQPESVPINLLIPVAGTPLEGASPVDPLDLVRVIALTRILIPKARVRLSAGRVFLSREAQVLAFYAGANSLWLGEKLLTRPNPDPDQDQAFLSSVTGAATVAA